MGKNKKDISILESIKSIPDFKIRELNESLEREYGIKSNMSPFDNNLEGNIFSNNFSVQNKYNLNNHIKVSKNEKY